ncbi:MAG: hypothetical protein KCHDKBKB_00686 [Elusimicrobia bacterium]|nr:hypothetical protein [Elusimicrobiota bacterium]
MSTILKLDREAIFYVPSTTGLAGKSSKATIAKRVSEIAKQFSQWFGGVTVTKVTGGYIADNGEYITETIHTVASSTDSEGLAKHRGEVERLAETKRTEWGQETIGLKFIKGSEFDLIG